MVRARHTTPVGHGELLTEPAYETWARIAEQNAEAASGWRFRIGGIDASELREAARRESLDAAAVYSAAAGMDFRRAGTPSGLIIMTGHQPELYHPGVWVKDFLLQRLSDELHASAIDLVVDSDDIGELGLKTPCLEPGITRCITPLVSAAPGVCYACAPPPDEAAIAGFRGAGLKRLSTLPAPALARHFGSFCDALGAAALRAEDLAMAMTAARRAYEAPAGTDYMELAVTRQASTESFRLFSAALLADGERFAEVFNAELRAFRARTGTRSNVQPFPDLGTHGEAIEAPFWVIADGRRSAAWVRTGPQPMLLADGAAVCGLEGAPEEVAERLGACGIVVAPRAVTLTLFERMFVSDLFIHGTGGGRYDSVTDAVVRSYMGVQPPAYAVASMTLFLPLGGHVVTDEEVATLEQRLQRLEHNPDQLLGELEFEDATERQEAEALVAEKCELVVAIARDGADKKAIGRRIRAVNERLHDMMQPVVIETREELRLRREAREASEVLADRTYPYCLWNPVEVMDKVR